MIRKPPVAIVTCEYKPFGGGIATYAASLAQQTHAAGSHTTVFAPTYPGVSAEPPGPVVHRILGHHKLGPRAIWQLTRSLTRSAANTEILGADIRSVMALYFIKLVFGRRYRAMVHGSEATKLSRRSPLGWLARQAYAGADRVLFNSAATQAIFFRAGGRTEAGSVVYLGVDPGWFDPVRGDYDSEALRDGLGTGDAVVCSIGRIEPRKGQLDSVRAIAAAQAASGRRIAYAIVGEAVDQDYLQQIVSEAKRLQVRAIVAGRVSGDDVKRLLRQSACHLLLAQEVPGRIEGFGLALLEAGAQSCPSIAYAVGGIPEVLGANGLLVEPGSLSSVAAHIARLAGDPLARQAQAQRDHERARQFSWQKCASETFPMLGIWQPASPLP